MSHRDLTIISRSTLGLTASSIILICLTGCNTPLGNAAYKGDIQTVRTLLDQGADVNQAHCGAPFELTADTPLACAAVKGNVEVAQLLLERGAKVDAKSGGTYGDGECTPLG